MFFLKGNKKLKTKKQRIKPKKKLKKGDQKIFLKRKPKNSKNQKIKKYFKCFFLIT